MTARSFCTVTASTKRAVDEGAGQYSAPVAYLSSLAITPLWPLEGGTITQFAIESPRDYRECYHVPVAGAPLPDVAEDDLLIVSSVEYPVQYIHDYKDSDVPVLHIIVQRVKGT